MPNQDNDSMCFMKMALGSPPGAQLLVEYLSVQTSCRLLEQHGPSLQEVHVLCLTRKLWQGHPPFFVGECPESSDNLDVGLRIVKN